MPVGSLQNAGETTQRPNRLAQANGLKNKHVLVLSSLPNQENEKFDLPFATRFSYVFYWS